MYPGEMKAVSTQKSPRDGSQQLCMEQPRTGNTHYVPQGANRETTGCASALPDTTQKPTGLDCPYIHPVGPEDDGED